MTLYDVLECRINDVDEIIKQSFKRLASKYRPDRDDGDLKKFEEINHAYSILSNPKKRKRYNLTGEFDTHPIDKIAKSRKNVIQMMRGEVKINIIKVGEIQHECKD